MINVKQNTVINSNDFLTRIHFFFEKKKKKKKKGKKKFKLTLCFDIMPKLAWHMN
jgi:hypothetical protein